MKRHGLATIPVHEFILQGRNDVEGLYAREMKKDQNGQYKGEIHIVQRRYFEWWPVQAGQEPEFKWEHLLVNIFFKLKRKEYKVRIASCIACFEKPHQANILSYVKF